MHLKINSRYLFILVLLLLSLVFYVSLPEPDFPEPPLDSVQSMEKADTEDYFRRAYFTDYTRAEVVRHYQNQFSKTGLFGFPLPTLKLNYPPEESQALIRDQTRSTFLEELVHPLRESLFINGFEPKVAKDDIWYKGVHYRQKIIIRYVSSRAWVRIAVAGITAFAGLWLAKGWLGYIKKVFGKKI